MSDWAVTSCDMDVWTFVRNNYAINTLPWRSVASLQEWRLDKDFKQTAPLTSMCVCPVCVPVCGWVWSGHVCGRVGGGHIVGGHRCGRAQSAHHMISSLLVVNSCFGKNGEEMVRRDGEKGW